MTRRQLLSALIFIAWCAAPHAQQTPTFPSRSVTLVAPSSPGSAPDVLARQLALRLSKKWNATVFVVNRPGAGGDIGSESVARAEPDGYTLLLGSIANAVNPHLVAKVRSDARALVPVSMIATAPDILLVHPADGINSVAEFTSWLKSHPSTPAGHPGIGTTPHLSLSTLALQSQLPFIAIPYQGGGAAQHGFVANQVKFMFGTSMGVLGQIKGGRARPLAVTGSTRIAALPHTPTMVEAGYPDFVIEAWFGVFAPGGTPQPIVDGIAGAVREVVTDQDFEDRLNTLGARMTFMPPVLFAKHVSAEHERWGRLVKAANIRID
ncbi:Bug family tripartite tricarboxylate transporter substrate binding protein [Pigmentiphaga litoralis]|uniref:Tripartite-type tricarboxylate transporter receptor subunit TctC n=1 Tax=Pigmentiphaga litoralis TaxID=516702 RepID=A0A7Y9IS19_9BURK|nr:tripartite tricarboxylate transporter substrate binding protein [Pigmentiphaga litoralis]NYE24611.1 tripartite-type tricarboxylate transporter receptor subunit TctC [Pigmentiphaga litoralis]NYE81775.1 tripartite-type tricarboxylate transporter receptor subunit TctC [Pigmentiphaga litoralis]